MVKRYARRRVVSVERRVIRGTEEAIGDVLAAAKSGSGINTVSIERLHATFRALWHHWYAGGAPSLTPRRC